MGQRKKIKGEPSLSFKNKIVALSLASTWDECKDEWKFALYYYILNVYVTCLCSPRGIKNAVILVNEKTQVEILLCNSCAEDYFDIKDGGIIENSVRRLLKNNRLGMNLGCLDYLDRNTILNVREIENYDVGLKCRTDEWVIRYKGGINHKLIVFTNYEDRGIFNKIDCLLVEFMRTNDEESIKQLAYMRQYFLDIEATELLKLEYIAKINDLIDYYNIDINNYTIYPYKEKELARKSIERYIHSSLRDWLHLSEYFEKKIKSGEASILPHSSEYELGFEKERYLSDKKTITPQIVEIEGLEDEIKINHRYYSDEDDDWGIIKADAVEDLDFYAYAERVYDNGGPRRTFWCFVKFTDYNNYEWYGKFRGHSCRAALSSVHNIILVLAGNTLFQLDRRNW